MADNTSPTDIVTTPAPAADFAPRLQNVVQAVASSTPISAVVDIQKDGVTVDATARSKLNFITGTATTLTVTDNSASDRVDVTVATTAASRVVDGTITSAGAITRGTGFTVGIAASIYTVTFSVTWSAAPVVVCTSTSDAPITLIVTSISTTAFTLTARDPASALTSAGFNFIAYQTL